MSCIVHNHSVSFVTMYDESRCGSRPIDRSCISKRIDESYVECGCRNESSSSIEVDVVVSFGIANYHALRRAIGILSSANPYIKLGEWSFWLNCYCSRSIGEYKLALVSPSCFSIPSSVSVCTNFISNSYIEVANCRRCLCTCVSRAVSNLRYGSSTVLYEFSSGRVKCCNIVVSSRCRSYYVSATTSSSDIHCKSPTTFARRYARSCEIHG